MSGTEFRSCSYKGGEMKESYETFPFITITFVFVIFINIVAPLFGVENGVAIMVVLLWEFLVLAIIIPFMAYHKRDLPLVIIPVTISLLWIGMPVFVGGNVRMVQIDLSNATAMTIIGGAGGVVIATFVGLYRIWKDSKAIKEIKESVDKVGSCVGEANVEITSVRGSELKNIETYTGKTHDNMLSKVLPGMEKLDSINGFVTKIDINTQNSGGDIKMIFAEVNKMVEKLESLNKDVEQLKSQNTELRMENSQLKQRNRTLEYLQSQRNRDHDLEQ